jgi:hypothetical protein
MNTFLGHKCRTFSTSNHTKNECWTLFHFWGCATMRPQLRKLTSDGPSMKLVRLCTIRHCYYLRRSTFCHLPISRALYNFSISLFCYLGSVVVRMKFFEEFYKYHLLFKCGYYKNKIW